MNKLKLSEAATAILEGARETFDANISAKQGMRGGDAHKKGAVGQDKLNASVAYGEKEAGLVGNAPEKEDDHLPDYLKGTPTATPPGATPPVGSEPMPRLSKERSYAPSPQETMGRKDLVHTQQASANEYEAIRDRRASHLAPQTFQKNPGATFQSYAEGLDMSDDINALMEGENLSEDFVRKATVIFEAAVVSRLETIVEQVEQDLVQQFEEAVDQIKEELASKVDDYLNYVVEEWMEENELAVESGLKNEIAEEFIEGLRNLFVEHYIDIPEDRVDVVEEMAGRIDELEEELNEQISRGIEMRKEINEQKKFEAIYTACEGLSQTQVEKLKSLAEGVEFTTEGEFANKLETLKESYFKSSVVVADNSALDDEVLIEEERVSTGVKDPLMEQYVSVISKSVKK
jgi:hypothetical protein